jgi:aminoglycoside 6'-N-acetyltransferase
LSFGFIPLTEADLPLVAHWLAQPQVIEWWDSADQQLSRIERALHCPGIDPYRIDSEGRPLGYLQCYDVASHDSGLLPPQPAGTRGLDLFIGEPDCIGRGLGSALLRQFTAQRFADPALPRFILDPHTANRRAIRCFEKAGFTAAGAIETPWGPALLMYMDRPAGPNAADTAAGGH